MKKMMALLLTALLLTGLLTACGGSTGSEAMDSMNSGVKEELGAPGDMFYSDSGSTAVAPDAEAPQQNQKLIRTVELRTETEDLEALLAVLMDQVGSLGGYTEYQNVYNGSNYASYRSRSAELTIRIPAQKLDSFLNQVEGVSNVISRTERVDDVTLQYVDTESRVAALQTEHDRLVELMEMADNLTDLLTIEERLTEVRYQLESVASQLRVLENQVSYATVEMYIDEVEILTELEEPTVWQRIGTGFTQNLEDLGEWLQDLFVWVVTYSPQLLIFAGIVTLIVWLCRRAARKRKAPKSPYMPPAPPEEKI